MKTGAELIAEERQRQVDEEGYGSAHDDTVNLGYELARAGAAYALHIVGIMTQDVDIADQGHSQFPWNHEYWKPTIGDPVRQLVKAGALIAAEIDRLQRQRKVQVA